jgi:signal transduction histidine kinase
VERAPVVAIVDQQRLTQAMMNLSRNAVEHTPDGTVVSLGSRVEGDAVLLWVEDNGPGIAPDAQRRIFERFARGASRHTEGAGLGLAIAKVIAEAHGGAIRLSSRPGEGARFTLELPLDTAEDDGMFEDSWSEDRPVAEDAPMTGAY